MNKQIVIAEYYNTILVKRYVIKGDSIIFPVSSNPELKPLQIIGEHF